MELLELVCCRLKTPKRIVYMNVVGFPVDVKYCWFSRYKTHSGIHREFRLACTKGHYELGKWIYDRLLGGSAIVRCEMLLVAARQGNLEVFVWFRDVVGLSHGWDVCKQPCKESVVHVACGTGNLNVLKWMKNEGCFRDEFVTSVTRYGDSLLKVASKNGYLDILKWFVEIFDVKCDSDCLELAIYHSKLSVAKWLRCQGVKVRRIVYGVRDVETFWWMCVVCDISKKRIIGIFDESGWDINVMKAIKDRYGIVDGSRLAMSLVSNKKWITEEYFRWVFESFEISDIDRRRVIERAFIESRMIVLEYYMRVFGKPERFSSELLKFAAYKNSLRSLEWFHTNYIMTLDEARECMSGIRHYCLKVWLTDNFGI